jgi:hypothetical protein
MQVKLNSTAHSKPAESLVGSLYQHDTNISYPCYVTPADQNRVDFFNGWVCYRLYTCSPIPHVVTVTVVSGNKVAVNSDQNPYETLMNGLTSQISKANR